MFFPVCSDILPESVLSTSVNPLLTDHSWCNKERRKGRCWNQRRSLRYVWKMANKQQKSLQMNFPSFLVHEIPERGGRERKMKYVLSIYRTTPRLVPSIRTDARNGWLMVWKDNVIGFWKRLSPGKWLHVLLCDISDTESFLLHNHWHLRWEKQLKLSDITITTVVGKLWASNDIHSRDYNKVVIHYCKINGSCSLYLLSVNYWGNYITPATYSNLCY